MLTGKIYKNKLSSQEVPPMLQAYSQTRQIARVRSQPGLKITIPTSNIENMEQKLTKNQGIKKQTDLNFRNQYRRSSDKSLFLTTQIMEQKRNQTSNSEQIAELDRKMREHILKIEEKYECRISQLEATLEAKNQIIFQLKDSLEEKEKIIHKMQQQYTQFISASRLNTPRCN